MDREKRQGGPETPASSKIEMVIYTIQLRGQLSPRWAPWFGDLDITSAPAQDRTTLTGPVADQAALHGLLNKIRDLGLEILSVRRLSEDENE